MNYEEKYNNIVDTLQSLINDGKKQGHIIIRIEDIENAIPELKENENERIRKELIDAIQGLWDNDALPMPLTVKRKDEWIDWLEKQEERKPFDYENATIIQKDFAPKKDISDFKAKDWYVSEVDGKIHSCNHG